MANLMDISENSVSYENKYGALTLEFVTDEIPVSGFSGSSLEPDLLFSLDDAEKIALITGNCKIQLSPVSSEDLSRWYVVFHPTASTVRICSVTDMFIDPKINPTETIKQKRTPLYI